jgi:hypothetical protein
VLFKWVLALAALVLTATAALGLLFSFWANPSIQWLPLPSGATLVPRDGGPYRLSDGKPDQPQSSRSERIYIHVRDLNLATRELDVQVSYAPPSGQVSTASTTSPNVRLLLYEPTDTGVAARPPNCGDRVPAAVQQIQMSEASSVFSNASNASVNGRLPVKGNPAMYPTDEYSLTLCAGLQIAQSPGLLTDVVFLVQAEPELQDHEVFMTPSHGDAPKPTQLISLLIERNGVQQAFSYAMALLPLVIMAAFFGTIIISNTEPVNALAGAAAIFLTILPLRQVLIPSEVSNVAGVTRVDYLLGLELAAMVVVFMVWMARRK